MGYNVAIDGPAGAGKSTKAKKEAAVILHLPPILTPQHGSNIPHAVLSFN